MVETEKYLKWGTIAGLGGLGIYLAYRAITRNALADSYRSIITAKLKVIDLYADNKMTSEKFHEIDDPLEIRAAEIEPKLPKDLRELIIRDVFGLAGIYVVANAARIYLENRRRGKPPRPTSPPKGGTPAPPEETTGTAPSPDDLSWYRNAWDTLNNIPGVTKKMIITLWEWSKVHPMQIPSVDEVAKMLGISTALAAVILAAILVLPPYPI